MLSLELLSISTFAPSATVTLLLQIYPITSALLPPAVLTFTFSRTLVPRRIISVFVPLAYPTKAPTFLCPITVLFLIFTSLIVTVDDAAVPIKKPTFPASMFLMFAFSMVMPSMVTVCPFVSPISTAQPYCAEIFCEF